jgi:hypothetical protein
VGCEDLILLSVEMFNLRKCFAALCQVLPGLICAVYQVVVHYATKQMKVLMKVKSEL